MSTETIQTEKREQYGSQIAKRLRAAGKTPAVIYGHGGETVAITIPTDQMMNALRHRAHLVQLEGALSESALLKEVQWDAFGTGLLHVDFTRVDKSESTQVELSIVLRGSAPGTKMGGSVDQLTRALEIDCPVISIPEELTVSINELELDATITAADVVLPDGAKLVTDGATPVATCTVHVAREEEEDTAAATGAEPEVIGGKPEEGEAS